LPSRQPLPAKPAPTPKADTFKPSEVPLASILAKIKSSEGTAAPESLSEEVPDYDIGELITAWKAFVREKAEKEKADQAEEDYYVDEPPQPPPRRARPRQPPPRQRRPGRPRQRPRQRPRPQINGQRHFACNIFFLQIAVISELGF